MLAALFYGFILKILYLEDFKKEFDEQNIFSFCIASY